MVNLSATYMVKTMVAKMSVIKKDKAKKIAAGEILFIKGRYGSVLAKITFFLNLCIWLALAYGYFFIIFRPQKAVQIFSPYFDFIDVNNIMIFWTTIVLTFSLLQTIKAAKALYQYKYNGIKYYPPPPKKTNNLLFDYTGKRITEQDIKGWKSELWWGLTFKIGMIAATVYFFFNLSINH